MMKKLIGIITVLAITGACSEKQKDFASITTGMTKQEVLSQVGEPTKKNNLLLAELWMYDQANRTIVFRADTVFDIITSAEARIDSIESSLKETGSDLKKKLDNTADSLDSGGLRIKNKIMYDSVDTN